MFSEFRLTTAIGTPLDVHEDLHEEALERHLEDQWAAGIHGVLVAGSMGVMQMLRDPTYISLVERTVALSRGRGEILVGVGDTGLRRTIDRIDRVTRCTIDGVVVLTPYLYRFTQPQLIEYFSAIADHSPVPVYLYDVPSVTRNPLDLATYEALARHPHIRGAKVSGRADFLPSLSDRLGDNFRLVVAEVDKVAQLLREGFTEHLDGMFAVAPHWVVAIARAAASGNWDRAAAYQSKLTALRDLLCGASSPLGAFTAMMNARQIPGRFHAAPFSVLTEAERSTLLSNPTFRELIGAQRSDDSVDLKSGCAEQV